MDLPIFHDNLKSSGSWTAALAREQESWTAAPGEARARVRAIQAEEMLRRAKGALDAGRVRAAAELAASWAGRAEGRFDAEGLLALNRALTGAAADAALLRTGAPTPLSEFHDPTPAVLLPRMLENAFDWFGTDSFGELHPVEQAAVVYLRLLDLYPFADATPPTAQLAASVYLERAGLPPLVLFADETTEARYAQALDAAFRMLTQPLVELFAELQRRTIRGGLGVEA